MHLCPVPLGRPHKLWYDHSKKTLFKEDCHMGVIFSPKHHPHIAQRQELGPCKISKVPVGLNGRIALVLTSAVGTMWCAYAFAIIAFTVVSAAIHNGLPAFVEWLSQTFIQLVLLSVILVSQNISGQAADRRAEMTFKDAEATFHETQQIQAHLQAQDAAINMLLERFAELESKIAGSSVSTSPPK